MHHSSPETAYTRWQNKLGHLQEEVVDARKKID
jgi:hypothetical protein